MNINYEKYNQNANDEKLDWQQQTLTVDINNKELFILSRKCYHYTSLASFWRIIESSTFRATHVRFSNDSQEYIQGKSIIGDLLKEKGHGDINPTEEYFVICFCTDDDLLSQWREYGNGVSICMDFQRESVFSILESHADKDRDNTKYFLRYALPINVLYTIIDQPRAIKDGAQNCRFFRYDSNGYNKEEKINFSTITDAYFEHMEDGDVNAAPQMLRVIPYIKHGDFKEEKETRLVFSLPHNFEKDYESFSLANNLNRPFLIIKYGDIRDGKNPCKYIELEKHIAALPNFKSIISKYIKDFNVDVNTMSYGEYAIYISDGKNQPELFDAVEKACQDYYNDLEAFTEISEKLRRSAVEFEEEVRSKYEQDADFVALDSDEQEKEIKECVTRLIDNFLFNLEIKARNFRNYTLSNLANKARQSNPDEASRNEALHKILSYLNSKNYLKLKRSVSNYNKNFKIWCDGYWPIRKLTVGPTLDKDIIAESINRYCKSVFWLKYVEVDYSNTPYREKRS